MSRSVLDVVASTLREEGRPPEEIYRALLGRFVGAPYIWGGSSVCGTDCSGSVCASLSRAVGALVRVTADGLFRSFFTAEAGGTEDLEGRVGALFFLDGSGRAVHVAGYRGEGLFLNASSIEPGRRAALRPYGELVGMYRIFAPRLRVCPEERLRSCGEARS